MAVIALEGMQFYAYHGFYEEEQQMGTTFELDVYVTTLIESAATDDDLEDTVNYQTVYRICRIEMQETSQLLEHVGQRIVKRIKEFFEDKVIAVQLHLKKINPPLGDAVRCAMVQLKVTDDAVARDTNMLRLGWQGWSSLEIEG